MPWYPRSITSTKQTSDMGPCNPDMCWQTIHRGKHIPLFSIRISHKNLKLQSNVLLKYLQYNTVILLTIWYCEIIDNTVIYAELSYHFDI